MTDAAAHLGRPDRSAVAGWAATMAKAASAAGPPLLFGVRMWASVCLALYVAFWLQLDNPFWAGTSATIVCQPQLGASLRKGWFRMIGTLVGATMCVVLTACFPQDRVLFLGALALWGAAAAFTATMLRNFAAYAAALAGYTVAIVGGDLLGLVGGVDANAAFMLAVTRSSEICIGIVCAGMVLALTDLGGARRRLAVLLAGLTAGVSDGFAHTVATAGPELPDFPAGSARVDPTGRRPRSGDRCDAWGIVSNPRSFPRAAAGRGRLVRRTRGLADGERSPRPNSTRRGPERRGHHTAKTAEGTAVGCNRRRAEALDRRIRPLCAEHVRRPRVKLSICRWARRRCACWPIRRRRRSPALPTRSTALLCSSQPMYALSRVPGARSVCAFPIGCPL